MEDMMSPTTLHPAPVIPPATRDPLLELAAIFAPHLSAEEMRELAVSHALPVLGEMADALQAAGLAVLAQPWQP
jgi:hypothetical protein